MEFFVAEVTARKAADLMALQPNTAALFYRKIRAVIAKNIALEGELLGGEGEVDESYFGGHRKFLLSASHPFQRIYEWAGRPYQRIGELLESGKTSLT